MQPEKIEKEVSDVDFRDNFKPELMEEKEPIRKNEEYIHRVMAPSFVTDNRLNLTYGKA